MKKCPRCGVNDSPRVLKPKGSSYCPSCLSEWQRDRVKKIRPIIDALKDFPCADCGIKYPTYVMDFDHVAGNKAGNVSRISWSKGLAKVLEEIEKCELVCSNCHRIRTHARNSQPVVSAGSL